MVETLTDFEEATAAVGPGQRLVGLVKDDQAVYLVVPDGLTDDQLTEIAFEVKHGRPMSGYEHAARKLSTIMAEAAA